MKKLIERIGTIIRKRQQMPYRLKVSRLFLFRLVAFRLIPRYVYRFVKSPTPIDHELSQQSRKLTRGPRALYSAIFSFLLDGYVELTGEKLVPNTQQIVFFLVELTSSLDDYLDDHSETGISLATSEVLETPALQERIAAFRQYVKQFDCAEALLTYLKQMFVTYYEMYMEKLNTARSSLQFEDIVETVRIDTGTWFRVVMGAVTLFNEYQINDEVLNDFFLFGMVGKFADDMADLVDDIKQDSPNLLYALVRQNSEEHTLMQLAIKKGKRLDIAWWKKHCPITYMSYFKHIQYYYQQIQSSKVRMVSTLMFVPPTRGIKHPTLKKVKKLADHEK